MKLYKVSIGHTEVFAAGIDAEDVYNRRESLDHTFAYLPIVIEEVTLKGYDIEVTERNDETVIGALLPKHPSTLNRDQLKNWLTLKRIPFTPQWGEEKLRELAIANV